MSEPEAKPTRRHFLYADRRLREGASREVLQQELIERGLTDEAASELLRGTPAPFWTAKVARITTLVGTVIMICGGALFLGNVSGTFVTFDGAGTITVFIGAIISAIGISWKQRPKWEKWQFR